MSKTNRSDTDISETNMSEQKILETNKTVSFTPEEIMLQKRMRELGSFFKEDGSQEETDLTSSLKAVSTLKPPSLSQLSDSEDKVLGNKFEQKLSSVVSDNKTKKTLETTEDETTNPQLETEPFKIRYEMIFQFLEAFKDRINDQDPFFIPFLLQVFASEPATAMYYAAGGLRPILLNSQMEPNCAILETQILQFVFYAHYTGITTNSFAFLVTITRRLIELDEKFTEFQQSLKAVNEALSGLQTALNVFSTQDFPGLINNLRISLNIEITALRTNVIDAINESRESVSQTVGNTGSNVIEQITNDLSRRERVLTVRWLEPFKRKVDDIADISQRALENTRSIMTGETLAFSGLTATLAIIGTAVGAVGTAVGALTAGLAEAMTLIKISLETIYLEVLNIKGSVRELPEAIDRKLEERFRDFENKVAESVSLRIVGESYYKWDSVSSYYPTLTFIYVERDSSGIKRRVQIKTRLPQRSEDVDEVFVNALKERLLLNPLRTYSFGQVKMNYVHPTKRFKTTVSVSNKEQGVELLRSLLALFEEELNPADISFTEGRKRTSVTRRAIPLGEIGLNPSSYLNDFNLVLYRAVLMVNGLERPIVVYRQQS